MVIGTDPRTGVSGISWSTCLSRSLNVVHESNLRAEYSEEFICLFLSHFVELLDCAKHMRYLILILKGF
jgi:hypothetical protein